MPYKKHKQYRLPGYNYSSAGDYFITICTKNRVHHFGRIIKVNENVTIELTPIGSFVNKSILSIPDVYKNIKLGETIVMPNHVHLILHLPYNHKQSPLSKLIPSKGLQPLQPGSVSSIINHLKGGVKKWCNAN